MDEGTRGREEQKEAKKEGSPRGRGRVIDYNHRVCTGAASDPQSLGTPSFTLLTLRFSTLDLRRAKRGRPLRERLQLGYDEPVD